MKISKLIALPNQFVEIEIDGQDAVDAILGETEGYTPKQLLLRVLNNLAPFFRKLPDTLISEMGPNQRKLIADFFAEQEKRFR